MGARVALEIVRQAPDRVERLALISTGVHAPRAGEAKARHARLSLGLEQGMDALLDAWLPPMVKEENQRRPGLMDRLRAMCERAGIDAYERQIRALLGRPEVESLLPGITCPTLVAVGRQDLWSPVVQHEQIAAAVPGARLEIIEESGHMLPAEQPETLTSILAKWLDSTDA
jgi:pimeloyl-ACP methyl ester carboxylesterase